MASKLAIVEEEADESIYWLELLVDAKILTEKSVAALIEEGNALVAMTVSSRKTLGTKENQKSKI